MSDQCPATTRHTPSYSVEIFGLQCKFTKGHHGDHCAFAGFGKGDVFWRDPAIMTMDATITAADADRIRDAMTEARDHPGRTITR